MVYEELAALAEKLMSVLHPQFNGHHCIGAPCTCVGKAALSCVLAYQC